MKPLIVFVLRLLLQLALFAITGRWHAFGRASQEAPQPPRRAQAGPRRQRTFRPDKQPARVRASRVEGALPDYADEGTFRDPEPAVAEGGVRRAQGVRAARAVPRAAAPTSLQAAFRDRRTLRDALILDAALGLRRRNH